MRTRASELVKSNSNEYMMDEDNAVRNTSGESDVAFSASFSSSGTVLDVDILFLYLPHVSWKHFGSKKKASGLFMECHGYCICLALPPVSHPRSLHFPHHFAIISFIPYDHSLLSLSLLLPVSLSPKNLFPFLLAVSLSHAALFTVWKCPKLPATTYYKMHSSRAWISVWLWQPQCMLGKW